MENYNIILDRFNIGRVSVNGVYAISMATQYRPYYALWRLFPDARPLFVRTLAVTLDAALQRAMTLLHNCNIVLECRDNSEFEVCYGRSEDIIPFGKYRGKRIAEAYYVDPSYVMWLANKFQPGSDRFDKLIALARQFSVVHFELTIRKPQISSVSNYIGSVGDKFKDMFVEVLNVKRQVDGYKPDFYVDQNILAADRNGNRVVFLVKAAGRSFSPKELSCYTREIKKGDTLHLLSSKVMSQYESRGVRYTRLGYVKLEK